MVTTFCLRLAFGMMAPMLILPANVVPPRFFRVQFLSTLALLVLAGLFVPNAHAIFWIVLGFTAIVTIAGSIVWHTDEAPFGKHLCVVAALATVFLLMTKRMAIELAERSELTPEFLNGNYWWMLNDVLSGFLLGAAVSAMLMGHSYLIAPAMSLSPLNRTLALLAAALAIRIGVACWGLYEWTRPIRQHTLDMETGVWLAARWLVGLILPTGLTWMAWESARIRSTQSATGILYVVTVLVFLGELLAMLLGEKFTLLM